MTFTIPDTIPQPPTEAPNNRTKPGPDDFHRQLQAEVKDAATELGRDQKALEAAKAKVADLTRDVEFDQMRLDSRQKGLDTFERLSAKANR